MKFKNTIVNMGFKVLGKGLVSSSKIEPAVQEELKSFEEGYVIELKVFNTDTKVAVQKVGNEFKYLGSEYNISPDLSVIFKSYEAALLLVLGQIGVYEGYAQHRFIVKGDFIRGMSLVRILYYVEAYLFPNFISKKILKEMPERSSTKLNAYLHLLI